MPSSGYINRTLYGSPSMLVERPRSTLGNISSVVTRPVIAAANLPYQPYLPDPDNPEDSGIDISLYNWGPDGSIEPDWVKLASFNSPKIKYVIVRMGISWGYIDPYFKRSWEALKLYTDCYRMAYHVIYVSQQVDPQIDNIEKAYDSVGGDIGEGIHWEDWELSNNQPRNVVSARMGEMLDRGPQRLGIRFGGYTGKWFVDAYAEEQPWMADEDWWMANYLHPSQGKEHPGPPLKPVIIPREKVGIHQTSSYVDGRVVGVPGNIRVDWNRFELKHLMTLEEYLDISASPQPPPTPGVSQSDLIRAEAQSLRRSADQLDTIADDIERLIA